MLHKGQLVSQIGSLNAVASLKHYMRPALLLSASFSSISMVGANNLMAFTDKMHDRCREKSKQVCGSSRSMHGLLQCRPHGPEKHVVSTSKDHSLPGVVHIVTCATHRSPQVHHACTLQAAAGEAVLSHVADLRCKGAKGSLAFDATPRIVQGYERGWPGKPTFPYMRSHLVQEFVHCGTTIKIFKEYTK